MATAGRSSMCSGRSKARPRRPVEGFVDDDPSHLDRLERLGVALLGDLDHLAHLGGDYVLGIGTSATRRRVVERLGDACTPIGIVHPGASIGSDCRIGQGVVVFERSVVTTNVTIGDHTPPERRLRRATRFSRRILHAVQPRGAGERRLRHRRRRVPGLRGDSHPRGDRWKRARVGAGAVVLSDVAPGRTVIGLPARSR
ncbi:MAG: hypothetical protein M5U19_20345 [Microthrixaceae bacterium]|nr:hypothetical protein [Microthrixaceae bacterium]